MSDVIVDDALVDFADKSFKIDGKKEAKKIVQALKKCPQVAVLRLSGNTLGVEGAEAIGSELSNHPNLKRCLFSDIFTGRMVDEIAPALRHLSAGIISAGTQLTELDLSDNAFGPRGVVGVTELLASPVCYTLQTLKMNNQGLGHQGCRHLTEALLKGLRDSNGSGPKLKTFSAGRNRLENYGAKLLAGVFSEMKSLEELYLYQNGIGIHGMDGIQCLVNAIALNSNLRVLNLSDNTLTADGGTELARSLVYLSNLEELILDDCLIRGRGCRSLANELERENVVPNLTCLRLYGNEITRDAGVHLALCLAGKTKLKHLNLNANEFGSEGIDMVIRTLESIDLIEALEVPPADRSTDDSVSDDVDPRYRAFDEDQGSDNEEEDDYEEGEYNEGEEAEDFEDDEVCPTESGLHSMGKSADSSFQTVKERSVGGPFGYVPPKSTEKQTEAGGGVFSFRSVLSDIQNEANANHGSNLFSALDSTDASVCRSKLWANASIGSKAAPVSGLFAPPRLGIVVTPPKVNPPSGGLFTTSAALQPAGVGSKFKEAEALDCLKRCMASPEDDELMRILADKLPCWSKWNINEVTLIEISTTPEALVRFAFRFARQHGSNPNQMDLAIRALLSACTADSHPVVAAKQKEQQLISLSGRAVNQILVHVGAMKPDRSDPTELKASEEVMLYSKTYLEVLKCFLTQHGARLDSGVRQSLALLLSQHKEAHPQAPLIANALDDVLGTLEAKLGSLSVS